MRCRPGFVQTLRSRGTRTFEPQGYDMAIDTAGPLQVNATPYWSHQTVLDRQPVGSLARAFVRHHLAAHRLFHLVDIVSLVTVKLTGIGSFARDSPLTLSLSQTDAVVLLRIDDTSLTAQAEGTPVVDESIGTGVFGLLTLQWGVSRIADEAKGLWATFDAHRHKQHAVATIEDGTTSTEDRLAGNDAHEAGP